MTQANLWAPWRAEYVGRARAGGCIFCAFREAPDDPESLVVAAGRHALVALNRFPYTSGHLMVAPLRHVGRIEDLAEEESSEIWRFTVRAKRTLDTLAHPDGYNVGWNLGSAAGAGVADHLHQHIVPRWCGDTNFMPVLGDVRVISEHLEKTRLALREEFGR